MTKPFQQALNPFTGFEQEQKQFIKEIDNLLRERVLTVLANPNGEQLLDTLDDMYVRQPVSPPGCTEGYGYYREGQNSLILKLRRIVAAAKQVTG